MTIPRKRESLTKGELFKLSGQSRRDKHGAEWRLSGGGYSMGSRTRGSVDAVEIQESSDDEVSIVTTVSDEVEKEIPEPVEEDPAKKKKSTKPSNSRVVLELDQIKNVIGQLACRQCGSAVQVSVRNVCIASSVGIECMNEDCGFLYHPQPPAATTIHQARGDNFERSTDYAVNVLYVLGFISIGDGCTEAPTLLGLLGLPNDTTMKS
jgi:hypothetical protein